MASIHLVYDPIIGKKKLESIVNTATPCPFCYKKGLKNIISEEGPMILLKNKFPTLKEAYQTVLIETDTCDGDFSTYDKEHLHRLFRFAFKHWFEMIESEKYKSVVLFKSFGPFSGGSIRHAHMQIIGLKEIDYKNEITKEYFLGKTIAEQGSVSFNLSTKPKIGFYEFNVVLREKKHLPLMADYVQVAVRYILNHFPAKCESYNLFFYELDKTIYAKIIPRFATSPLYVGYAIPQVASNIDEIVGKVKELYDLS